MNQIRHYRGMSVNKKKWVYGLYLVVDNFGHEQAAILEYPKKDQPTHVIKSTVGQYTGLKDKDGKEIFEGDKTQRYKKSGKPYAYATVKIIEWGYQGFNVSNASECEVIGNIHEGEK